MGIEGVEGGARLGIAAADVDKPHQQFGVVNASARVHVVASDSTQNRELARASLDVVIITLRVRTYTAIHHTHYCWAGDS